MSSSLVTVKFDDRDLKNGIEGLKQKFPQAVRRALLRAGTSGRAEMAKLMSADTGLPSRRVKDNIQLVEVGGVAVQLVATGRRIPLIDFRARGPEPSRGKGRGVSWSLPSGRGSDAHAFIATMPSGHRGVFRRTGIARLPIRELRGPSLVHVFRKFLPAGAARATVALMTNLRSEIAFATKR